MWQLYLIEQLDHIQNFLLSLLISGTICLFFILFKLYVGLSNSEKKYEKISKRIFYPLLVISFLYSLTPSTKKAYSIFAIGSVFEYLKDNDTAKQLPDKCLKAVDKYLETFNVKKDEQDETSRN